jgi:hypothetical protein
MNPESIFTEEYFDLASPSALPSPQVVIPVVPQPVQPMLDSRDDDLDPEDGALAKAPTWMMGEEAGHNDADVSYQSLNKVPRFYVQGIVHQRQAYLITNLIAGESQRLIQPQMVWTIGRNREAALPLRDRVLSRRHAVILYVPNDGFHLIDLNSMNGSYVNGLRIQQRQALMDGDRIRMGELEFNFFTSCASRTIEAIHPEVLARFTSPQPRNEGYVDYSELEEPEIFFNTTRRTEDEHEQTGAA